MPIRKVKDGFKIDNTDGVSKTKKEALKRLGAIKASQADDKNKEVATRRNNTRRTRIV